VALGNDRILSLLFSSSLLAACEYVDIHKAYAPRTASLYLGLHHDTDVLDAKYHISIWLAIDTATSPTCTSISYPYIHALPKSNMANS
jgi:hypothetical protein